jgi:signal transduction histidine kinase
MEAELGNGWVEGVHRDDLERCISTYEQSFDRRETFRMEYRLRRQDGEYRWVLDTGVPRLAADGAFIGYIGSCVDITEDKLAQNVLSGLSQKLMDAQEKERAWIARELHDDVGQRMAVLTIDLERLRETLPGGAGELRLRIGEVSGRVSDLGKDLQVIAHRLHSSKLEYLGIAAAAREFCRDLSDKHGVTIAFTHEGVRRDLPKEVALALFRVLQEASTNTITHAGVSHFSVALRGGDDDVQLEVVDSGIGFDPKAVRGHGLGLVSMQERMSLVEGAIAIDSRLGSGTRVRAQVALSASRRLAVGGV